MAALKLLVGLADRLAGGRVADLGKELEVTVRMAGLALGDRAEQRRGIGIALDVGLLREPQVAAVRLALAGEALLQVLVGLGAFEAHDVDSLSTARVEYAPGDPVRNDR